MPEHDTHEKARISVEQLIALKRSERPDPEFWEGFEKEFQRRRLAALVQISPWYVAMGRGLFRTFKWLAPVAAAGAVVAFAFSHYSRESIAESPSPAPRLAAIPEEPAYTMLAEEYVPSPGARRASVSPAFDQAPLAGWENLHYKVREIAMHSAAPQRFVTMAVTQVLAASDEVSGTYPVRTLTASPALSLDSPVASASF